MTNPLADLAAYASAVRMPRCPQSVLDKARALLLYGVAVGVSSAGAPMLARIIRALQREYGSGVDEATSLTDGSRMSAGAAAYCNAALFHVRIQDDAHPAGHMGAIILPAALAMAEAQRSSGADLIAAVIGGYEVSLRIGRDHAADLSSRGFRTTPIYGAMGAAAACARLLGLDAERTRHALALTTHTVSGLREFADAGTDEYPFQAGFAARSGVTAAYLAAEGLTGTDTALTGRAGLLRAYGDPQKDYAQRLAEGLGTSHEIETVTYKPYPGGQFHRGVIRGFSELSAKVNSADIESARIHMHPFEANYLGVAYNGPFHTYTQAFFSMAFCAALAWLHHTVTFAALNRFDDPRVLGIVAKTRVVADEARPRYKPLLRVTLEDGRILEWEDDAGESTYNLTWEVAVSMTQGLFAEAGVPGSKADELAGIVREIDSMKEIAPLVHSAAAIAAAVTGRG